ncbi:TetR/AcrR family transcriptional regulator [Anderseniella sp. Alg231-50]|uniref:TetR/AcrR family transcriptional regulator n=1 Tax=Anderseniella sp. Alg231-50 TaxID=1922226 RepID=UPI000D5594BC
MARPDIKTERREQILDAFESCVSRYGVEGATLAKTAEMAGLARPLVRHNVGNRDELLEALVDRFLERTRNSMATMISALPAENKAKTAIDWLFDPKFSDPQLVRVSNALIAASCENPSVAARMLVWLNDFITRLDELLADEFPDADPEKVAAATAGITGIYFNIEALYPLGDTDVLVAASKRAAIILLESLETSQ